MFFWIGLLVVFVLFASIVAWGVRGIERRAHKPGTRRLD